MNTLWPLTLLLLLSSGTARPTQSLPLTGLDGKPFDLKAEAANGPLILDVWATWCKPCIKSLRQMQALVTEYEAHGLRVFSVNIDGPRNRAKIRPFLQRHRLSLPVLLDDTGQFMRQFHFVGPPAAVFFDRQGKAVHSHQGYRPGDEKKWRAVLDKMLDGQTTAPPQESPDASPPDPTDP